MMNCPYCQSPVDESTGCCTGCGAQIVRKPSGGQGAQPVTRSAQAQPAAAGMAKTVTDSGLLLGKAAREARMKAVTDSGEIVSDRVYNGVIIGVLLWGLLVNYVLCALFSDRILNIRPMVLLIGYVVVAFAGIFIAARSHHPLVSFLGYNMVVVPFGLVISYMIAAVGGMNSQVVTYAFLYTMLITIGMFACYLIAPQFFAKLGGALLAVLGGLILCELVLLILRVDQVVTDWLVAGLFSLYIGYDIHRSQQYPKTVDNAVDSALDIYMDIANLFLRILMIMARSKRRD